MTTGEDRSPLDDAYRRIAEAAMRSIKPPPVDLYEQLAKTAMRSIKPPPVDLYEQLAKTAMRSIKPPPVDLYEQLAKTAMRSIKPPPVDLYEQLAKTAMRSIKPPPVDLYEQIRKAALDSIRMMPPSPGGPYQQDAKAAQGSIGTPAQAAGASSPETAAVFELFTADLRSIAGTPSAPWLVALWVFVIVVWVRLHIGELESGSYSPAVLSHLFEGGAVGASAATAAWKGVNHLGKSPGSSTRKTPE